MAGRDDEHAGLNPSPRTTIVGGRPPETGAALPPVPTGLQRLLRLASVDAGFRGELVARRAAVAAAAGVELTASERAILAAIPAAQLEAMIGGLSPPAPDRRGFLREAAASAVVLLGGAALGACDRVTDRLMPGCGGAAPDIPRSRDGGFAEPPPPRQYGPMRPAGIRPEMLPPRPPEPPPPRPEEPTPVPAGARPELPPDRPAVPETPRVGGARPDLPGGRPDELQHTRGIRPDVPRPRPDGGVPRPDRPPVTKGIRPDLPGSKDPTKE
jgi:hypothetical protein